MKRTIIGFVAVGMIVATSSAHVSVSARDVDAAPARSGADVPSPPFLPGFRPASEVFDADPAAAGRAAEAAGLDDPHLAEHLAHDDTAWVGPDGEIAFVDPAPELSPSSAPPPSTSWASVVETLTPEEVFALHSAPGASRVLHLDFDGYELPAGSGWNGGVAYSALPYDSDGDVANWSTTELEFIVATWQMVSDDFAAFDIDVTTEFPGDEAIRRSSLSDPLFGGRVVITGSPREIACSSRCAGVSYLGNVDAVGADHDRYQPSWAFASTLQDRPDYAATVISHEFGHALGLSHDGIEPSTEYYEGHGMWTPIMGVGYYQPVQQWSRGEYAGATNTQDDFAVVQANMVPLRPDDADASTTAPQALLTSGARGVIGANGDVDTWRFTAACAGIHTVSVRVTDPGSPLSVEVQLLDATGAVLAADASQPIRVSSRVASGLGGAVTHTLTGGAQYVVMVRGLANGTASTGWTNYANSGFYWIDLVRPECRPVNDDRTSATELSGARGSIDGATSNATRESGEPVPGTSASPTVWYRYTPTRSAEHRFDVCEASFDAVVAVYAASGEALVSTSTPQRCDPDAPRALSLPLTAGTEVWIQVTGATTAATGEFRLAWAIPDSTPPVVTVTSPVAGAVLEQDAAVTFEFSCSDPDSVVVVCDGSVPAGTLVTRVDLEPGEETTVSLSVSATNEDGLTTTVTRDVVVRAGRGPVVEIRVPENASILEQGAVVTADYSCTDAVSAVTRCEGPVDDGEPIDTTTIGSATFDVTAEDGAGWGMWTRSSYVVEARAAPRLRVRAPVAGAVYERSRIPRAAFRCTDRSAVTRCSGTVGTGQRLPARLGVHRFRITAVDEWGNTRTRTISYRVVDTIRPRITIAWPGPDATVRQGSAGRPDVRCRDEVGGSGIVTCRYLGWNVLTVGTHRLTVRAEDAAGNVRDVTRTYRVVP